MKAAMRHFFCLVGFVAVVQWLGPGHSPAGGLAVAAGAPSAASSSACNVRSASGCGGPAAKAAAHDAVAAPRGLSGSERWKFNSLSLRNSGQFVWLYRGSPYDITIDTSAATTSSSSSSADFVMDMTLTIVDTFRVTVVRQPSGQLFKAFEVVAVAPERDTIKLIAQYRMVDLLRQLDSIDASDPNSLVLRAGTWTLSFDRVPPTDGQEWRPPTLPLEVRAFDVVPETYFVDGRFENLFPTLESRIPLRVFLIQTSDDSLNVLMETSRHVFVYRVYYQPQDGWVSRVELVAATSDENAPVYDAERKVVDIIRRVQQLSFEDDNLVQFITNNGNTRISFAAAGADAGGKYANGLEGYAAPLPYVAPYFRDWSYGQRRLFLVQQQGCTDSVRPLVPWGNCETPALFMTVAVKHTARGHLALTILGVNTVPFDIDFDESTGAVRGVVVRPTTNIPTADSVAADAERRVRRALGTSVRLIATETDGIVFLNPRQDATLTLVRLPAELRPPRPPRTYDLKPETYMIGGRFDPALTSGNGAPLPITLTLQESAPGVGQFVLRGANSIVFEVTWQPEDGWVTSVMPGARTHATSPRDLVEAEQRVAQLLGMVQQLAFEQDGLLQLISNNGRDRVAFAQRRMPRGGRRLMADSAALKFARYLVEPSTYMAEGQLQALFGRTALPAVVHVRHLEPGHISLAVEVVNTMPYDIYYDEVSGLVSQVVPGAVVVAGVESPEDVLVAEQRLRDLLSRCHAVVFLDEGIKFSTVDGGVAARGLTVGDYAILPQTYMRDGVFERLAVDPRFPITLTLIQDEQGNAKALLKAVNVVDFYFRFQRRDGWVLRRQEIGRTRRPLTREQRETERKLVDLLRNAQQLAFEKDGVLQVIADNGRTRVSFKGENHAWWENPFRPAPAPTNQHAPDFRPFYYPYSPSDPAPSDPAPSDPAPSDPAPYASPLYDPTPYQPEPFAPAPGDAMVRHVAPNTYRKDGRSEPLFTGPDFSITVAIRRPGDGYADITLNMINRFVYGVYYQTRDGWVTAKVLRYKTPGYPSAAEAETEAKIIYIFDNLQQIAFETSGQVQFITDNAQTRISFV